MVVMFAEGFFQTVFHVYIYIYIYIYIHTSACIHMQVDKNLLIKFNPSSSKGLLYILP
jgi:hypothetical protein